MSAVYPDIYNKLDTIVNDWRDTIVERKNKDPNSIVPDAVQPPEIIGPADIPLKDRDPGEDPVPDPGDPPMVSINFQPASALVPAGYLPDTSQVFGDRGNGHSYGWVSVFDRTR